VVINSGDRLTTTCSYDNRTDQAITYGEFSEREMCTMMLWTWPAGRLHSADAGTATTQPDVTCGQ
jgi:Copper type II ascorbate-dependent monooxygenase, C-terminal domain